MLLVTARDEAVSLPTSAGVRRLPLAGLDRRATAALVQHIVGVEASLDYIAEVYRRTGGNPFFTSEVARLQVSRGTPTGAIRRVCGRSLSTGSPGCPRSLSSCSRWPAWSARRTSASWLVSRGCPRSTSRPARRTGCCRGDCRGRIRTRSDARDAVPGNNSEASCCAPPPGRRASPGWRSGRAGRTLVAGVGGRRPDACGRTRACRRRYGSRRAGSRAGDRSLQDGARAWAPERLMCVADWVRPRSRRAYWCRPGHPAPGRPGSLGRPRPPRTSPAQCSLWAAGLVASRWTSSTSSKHACSRTPCDSFPTATARSGGCARSAFGR